VREFHDDHDAVLDEQFGVLRNNVTMLVPVPPAEEIVARGRRRRQAARAMLASLAVVLAVGAGYTMIRPLRAAHDPAPPAGASPTVTGSSYTPSAGSQRDPVGRSILAGFLPAEGRRPVDRRGLGTQCPGGGELASDGTVIAASSLKDAKGGQVSLLLYEAGLVASRAFDEYKAEATRCESMTHEGLTWRKEIETLTFGGASLRVTTRYTRNTNGALPPTRTEVAIRNGSALLLVGGDDAEAVDRVWAGLLDRLCLFATGCKPRDARPAAVASLTAGGQAWAVALAKDSAGDPSALGRAVAAAAEMGYRTSVTDVDCDAGARSALGMSEGPHKYVAVYFATRADADAFAASSTRPAIGTFAVHTYCIG
jgi:hypothetical protein